MQHVPCMCTRPSSNDILPRGLGFQMSFLALGSADPPSTKDSSPRLPDRSSCLCTPPHFSSNDHVANMRPTPMILLSAGIEAGLSWSCCQPQSTPDATPNIQAPLPTVRRSAAENTRMLTQMCSMQRTRSHMRAGEYSACGRT